MSALSNAVSGKVVRLISRELFDLKARGDIFFLITLYKPLFFLPGLDAADHSQEELLSVGQDIVEAFRSSGFVYITNHGISQQLQENTFGVAKSFFQLEDQQKMKYERFVKAGYNGYTPIGGENSSYANDKEADLIDYKECYDLHVKGEVST